MTGLTGRVDRDAVLGLLPGDMCAILAFLVVGELHHGLNPLAVPWHFAGIALPFLLGWAVVAPLAGAYRRDALVAPRAVVLPTVLAWAGADVLAQALRSLDAVVGAPNAVFAAVTFGVGVTFLLAWRLVAATVRRPDSPGAR